MHVKKFKLRGNIVGRAKNSLKKLHTQKKYHISDSQPQLRRDLEAKLHKGSKWKKEKKRKWSKGKIENQINKDVNNIIPSSEW